MGPGLPCSWDAASPRRASDRPGEEQARRRREASRKCSPFTLSDVAPSARTRKRRLSRVRATFTSPHPTLPNSWTTIGGAWKRRPGRQSRCVPAQVLCRHTRRAAHGRCVGSRSRRSPSRPPSSARASRTRPLQLRAGHVGALAQPRRLRARHAARGLRDGRRRLPRRAVRAAGRRARRGERGRPRPRPAGRRDRRGHAHPRARAAAGQGDAGDAGRRDGGPEDLRRRHRRLRREDRPHRHGPVAGPPDPQPDRPQEPRLPVLDRGRRGRGRPAVRLAPARHGDGRGRLGRRSAPPRARRLRRVRLRPRRAAPRVRALGPVAPRPHEGGPEGEADLVPGGRHGRREGRHGVPCRAQPLDDHRQPRRRRPPRSSPAAPAAPSRARRSTSRASTTRATCSAPASPGSSSRPTASAPPGARRSTPTARASTRARTSSSTPC
jgi:hypothetical protein